MAGIAHAKRRAPDAKARLLREGQLLHAVSAVLGKKAVQRADVLGDELAVVGAVDAKVVGGDVRVVHDHVVVESAPHSRLVALDRNARGHVAVVREHLDPHQRAHSIASRNLRPTATALAWETPCMVSCASSASRSRSCESARSVTLYNPSNSR